MIYLLIFLLVSCEFKHLTTFFIIVEDFWEQGLYVIFFVFYFCFVLFYPIGSPTGPDTFENLKHLRLGI